MMERNVLQHAQPQKVALEQRCSTSKAARLNQMKAREASGCR